MSTEFYRQRDLELLEQIAFYHADNAEHEKQISLNNVQIMALEKKRHELYREYRTTPPQRNLQGEIIKKEVA